MSIMSALEDVERFHKAAGIENLSGVARLVKRKLRKRLLKEEMRETNKAIRERDMVQVADGYADMLFVLLGSCLMQLGKHRAARVWKEVVRANMDKCIDGKVIMRDDGKVLKPEGWRPPNLQLILSSPEPDVSVLTMEDELLFAVDTIKTTLGDIKQAIEDGVDKATVRTTLDQVMGALTEMRHGVEEML